MTIAFILMRYSIFALARQALRGHRGWPPTWRKAEPAKSYDVVIVGGGGHGLATAYYLAKVHGMRNVAVLEKGWIGGGNTGRNTTIIRSNYMLDDNAHLYEWSLKLWHDLSQELNYNVMFSPRGVLNLAHTEGQRDAFFRRGNRMLLNGIDAEWLDREQVARFVPNLDCSSSTRFPVIGGLLQRRGGTARHDAVAWGYARAASALGVDIIENCEVRGFVREGDRITAVETSRGRIGAGKVAMAVAGTFRSRRGDGRPQAADRNASAAGVRVGAAEADHRHRDHLRRRALLRQPVGQGRAGDGRRSRFLPELFAARQSADRRGVDRRRAGDVPDAVARPADAAVGAA